MSLVFFFFILLTLLVVAVQSKEGTHQVLRSSNSSSSSSTSKIIEEEDIANINHRQTQTTRNIDADANNGGCFICARLGTTLDPSARPWGNNLDKSCQEIQNSIKSILDPTSKECTAYLNEYEYRCCTQGPSQLHSYECETNIRKYILDEDSYDASVAPIHAVNGTMQALKVDTFITFFAVKELNVKTSTLDIFVSIDLSWNDPRLAWDGSNTHTHHNVNIDTNTTNCATRINVRADHTMEETEIWVPSLDLTNRASSIQDFPMESANVQPDGTVQWSRLGSLTAICAFVGLRRMPFDDLGCRLVFGNNDISPLDYVLVDLGDNHTKGFAHWDAFDVSYSEFNIVDEKSRTKYSSLHPGVFEVDLFFHRARRHYVIFTLIPNVLFTYISFGQFSFGITDGDRLSFSITVVLIIVTQSIVTASLLPICSEMLWLNAFNLISMLFTLAGILESLVIFLLYKLIVSKKLDEDNENDGENTEKNKGGGKGSILRKDGEEFVHLISEDVNNNNSNDDVEVSIANLKKVEMKTQHSSLSVISEPRNGNDDVDDTEVSIANLKKVVDPEKAEENDVNDSNHSITNITEHLNESLANTNANMPSDDTSKQQRCRRCWDLKWSEMYLVQVVTTRPRGVLDMMQRADSLCSILFPLGYTFYITLMFAYNEEWDEDPNKEWSPI